jgi:hypothetical protein
MVVATSGIIVSVGCCDDYVVKEFDTLPVHAMKDLSEVDVPPARDVVIASLAGRDYTRTFLRMRVLPDDASKFLRSRAVYLGVPITDWIVIAEPTESVPEWVLTGELMGDSVGGSHQVPNAQFENVLNSITERWNYQEHSGELLGRITKVR